MFKNYDTTHLELPFTNEILQYLSRQIHGSGQTLASVAECGANFKINAGSDETIETLIGQDIDLLQNIRNMIFFINKKINRALLICYVL
jgi:Na+/H+ antiporter NhaC